MKQGDGERELGGGGLEEGEVRFKPSFVNFIFE